MRDSPVPPTLAYLARIDVEVAPPVDVGAGDRDGRRRIVPILGGRVSGPVLTGRVLPGGADFQVLRANRLTELEARYAIETDDGDRLYVENRGVHSVGGERVEPEHSYFRSSPRVSSSAARWAWLETRILIARGIHMPGGVALEVFVVE